MWNNIEVRAVVSQGRSFYTMSRRASLYAKQNPDKVRPKVRFPDELVFLDHVLENDMPALDAMLRRASLQIDINAIHKQGKYRA